MNINNVQKNNTNRMNQIKQLVKSDHMNDLEKEYIFITCEQYTDIFYLEGD